jgi:hypothetical protein
MQKKNRKWTARQMDLPSSKYFLHLKNNSLQKVITIVKTSQ